MPAEIRFIAPPSGSMVPKGSPFQAEFEQQAQGEPGQGLACLQFAQSESGPWQVCQSAAGPLRCVPQPWSAQDAAFQVQATLHQSIWARCGVWEEMPLGDPLYASNAHELIKGPSGERQLP